MRTGHCRTRELLTLLYLLFALGAFPRFSAAQDLLPVYPNELNYQNGLAYFQGRPLTGVLVEEGSNTKLGEFQNGRKVGNHIQFHRPGVKKEEGMYTNGSKTGAHRFYHATSKLKVEYTYNNDRVVDGRYTVYDGEGSKTVEEVYEAGKKVREGTYVGTDLFEPIVNYFPGTSSKQQEGELKNGRKHGLWKEWYNDGKVKAEENYVDGALNGKVIRYWPTGDRRTEEVYANGTLSETVYRNDVDPASSIKYALVPGAELFMILKGEVMDTAFAVVQFTATNGVGDQERNDQFKEAAFRALQHRMVLVEQWNSKEYLERKADYWIEFSQPTTDAVYDDGKATSSGKIVTVTTQLNPGYRGKVSLRMKVKDLKYSAELLNTVVSGKSEFIDATKAKAIQTDPVWLDTDITSKTYATFRVKAFVKEIVERDNRGNAKLVEIDGGFELGMGTGFMYNVYAADDVLGERRIGTMKATEIGDGSSTCKLVSGEEKITEMLNAGTALKVISAY